MKWASVIALAAGLIITSAHGAPVRAEFPYPTDIILAARIFEYDNGGTVCGDVYSRAFIQYKSFPTRAPGCVHPQVLSFAGWRISKLAPDTVAPCYTHAQCLAHNPGNAEVSRWFPGHRLSESEATALGRDIKAQTKKCPAGGGGALPADTVAGIHASAHCDTDAECTGAGYRQIHIVYGFDRDDPDGPGPLPAHAVTDDLPCGLPYKLVQIAFLDETGNRRGIRTRLFKVVVFEQWFGLYWRYDRSSGRYDSPLLWTFRQFSAIPPFPSHDAIDFDRRLSGGGMLKGADVVGTTRQPLRILLEGDYTLDEGLSGEGLIYVKGNLTVRGPLQYRGALIVQGALTLMPERRLLPEPPHRRGPPD